MRLQYPDDFQKVLLHKLFAHPSPYRDVCSAYNLVWYCNHCKHMVAYPTYDILVLQSPDNAQNRLHLSSSYSLSHKEFYKVCICLFDDDMYCV